MNRLTFMESLVRTLGKDLVDDTLELNIEEKSSHRDIVTLYDKKVEEMLCSAINKEFPQDTFLTEEETINKLSPNLWIIDPIDGTTNFAVMNAQFAISVAYYENYEEQFGIVYNVKDDVLYTGIKGKGAFKNNNALPPLPKSYSLKTLTFDINYPAIKTLQTQHSLDFDNVCFEFLGHRSYGSAAISICHIAENKLGLYCSEKLSIWDYAAGKIILEEVGGHCSLITNKELDDKVPLDDKKIQFIASQNKALSQEVLEKISK